jgi:hypothetical protein
MAKTKSQMFAEDWVLELVKTNGHIHDALRATKHEQRAIARLLRAGYASANFGDNKVWSGAGMLSVNLDEADVLLALANLVGMEAGLARVSHADIEREFSGD